MLMLIYISQISTYSLQNSITLEECLGKWAVISPKNDSVNNVNQEKLDGVDVNKKKVYSKTPK